MPGPWLTSHRAAIPATANRIISIPFLKVRLKPDTTYVQIYSTSRLSGETRCQAKSELREDGEVGRRRTQRTRRRRTERPQRLFHAESTESRGKHWNDGALEVSEAVGRATRGQGLSLSVAL